MKNISKGFAAVFIYLFSYDSAQKFNLDFDDAYQYAGALTQKLQIVSFDKDFDRTELGRK